MARCKARDMMIAPTRYMLRQIGKVTSDSDEERALAALSISMTTRIERETVEAVRAEMEFAAKIEQSRESAKVEEHRWKCV